MRNLWRSMFVGLWVIGMGLGVSAPAQAASGVGPYYATPSWDQKLDCTTAGNCPRFIVLTNWNSEAVLDRETGLVWEQSPSTSTPDWFLASEHCINLNAGSRTGWRLPTIQELLSLVDRSVSFPSLPSGHPFTNVQPSFYWSASTYASSTSNAWIVAVFHLGIVGNGDKSNAHFVWCVRGGHGVDPQ